MVASVPTGMVQGVEGILIKVEADISSGLPMMNLFGSLSSEAKEGRDRVRTALKNMGIHMPPNRITINLAPGDIRKTGTSFDLGIAVALLAAMDLLPIEEVESILFLGELSLDGSLLPVHGVLPILKTAREEGYSRCFVPCDNLEEASLLEGMEPEGFSSLSDVYDCLAGKGKLSIDTTGGYPLLAEGTEAINGSGDDEVSRAGEDDMSRDVEDDMSIAIEDKVSTAGEELPRAVEDDMSRAGEDDMSRAVEDEASSSKDITEQKKEFKKIIVRDRISNKKREVSRVIKAGSTDFCEVHGQLLAKRALEIAVAGFHNVMLDGPPGVGKSMVASCVPGIMPEMTMEEKIETTMIYSVRGLLGNDFFLVEDRPFRAPSHNITMVGMFGGGRDPVPGEISLAHHGVLFLDEFPEYSRDMIEMLRVPLENHRIILVRNNRSLEFPADFILIAASNPCPCGYYPDRARCKCSGREIRRYHNRISGPMRDRIDLFVRCEDVGFEILTSKQKGESSACIKARVTRAWESQRMRSDNKTYHFNGRMSSAEIRKYCRLTGEGSRMMASSFKNLGLSGRAYYKILKVSRTIADLAGEEAVNTAHLEEALLFRNAGTY